MEYVRSQIDVDDEEFPAYTYLAQELGKSILDVIRATKPIAAAKDLEDLLIEYSKPESSD